MNAKQETPQRACLPEDWFRRPAVARIDNFLTGGCDNYFPDRHLAGLLMKSAPWLSNMVKINQRHRPHVVTTLARDLGITQFLDLGCGLPSGWNKKRQGHDPALTYEAARSVHEDARVVYVDNDLMVCAHANFSMTEYLSTDAVQADIRKIDELLDAPSIQDFDRSQPIVALAHDLLPWVSDQEAEAAMAALREWLPAGSAISVTHATTDMAPEAMQDLVDHYAEAGIVYRPRSLEQIQAFLGPWSALPPGIVPTAQWRAGHRNVHRMPSAAHSFAYAAVITEALSAGR